MKQFFILLFLLPFAACSQLQVSSKKYPQLTTPGNMLRDKGMYYTEADLKELIAYCKEIYVSLVPEIDMPGHSAALATKEFNDILQK